MKLCKDCKHFIKNHPVYYGDRCQHPKLGIDLVYGFNKSDRARDTRTDSEDSISCGTEGKWWEPKNTVKPKTFWAKLWS